MADSNIGALPQAANLDDDSLLVAEQQGQAVKVTGAQFKEFGRQAVIGQVQGYVDRAEAAANRAADAVSAVTDMTVEAHSSETPTVTKTTKNGKINLAFGLPRGEQGVPGPEGKTGPRGPQGAPGNGLTILGHYDTEAALRDAVTAPEVGDAYGVGLEVPYDTYIFDGTTLDWKNYGPLSGGGGGVLPENVVTAEGGASMTFPVDLGDGPHTITFTEEEEPPLTADDITYEDGTVQEAIDGLKSSVSDGKTLVASAITDKGVPTAQDATFQQMAENIGEIGGGSDTSDATATSFDILAPKTAYTANGKVEGVIPTLLGQTITPGIADKTIANGQYLGGTQVIKGDPNLTSGNIKKGVTLFGVVGALESSFKATLTVTADVGAVVTATHTNGTKVEALSTTGTVVLELPLEGTWKVTAVRGMAQYNTVTLQVSSSYSAELTAEVHVVRYGSGTPLSVARVNLAAASVGTYALFAGGHGASGDTNVVDVYDKNYSHSLAAALSIVDDEISATAIDGHALFNFSTNGRVEGYNAALTKNTLENLKPARYGTAAAQIGGTALFGGGVTSYTSGAPKSSAVDAYNKDLVHSALPTGLVVSADRLAAASNDNYALFGGGYSTEYAKQVTAYDKQLTRSTPAALGEARSDLSATRAGNYILFAGGRTASGHTKTVEAYDLFLTRISVEELSVAREDMAYVTINGFALFGGGISGASRRSNVDCYDPYLTKTNPEKLGIARSGLAAAAVENFALFAGGQSSDGASSYVDIYQYT